MALTAEQQADLAELQNFRRQLRAVVYGGASTISVDGIRVNIDYDNARRSLRDCESQIAGYLGTAIARPTIVSVVMAGNYSDDNSSQTTETTP